MAYQVISTGSHRISARTLVVNGDNDAVYLCTTTQTTPRDLTYIHAQAQAVGGSFIHLNRTADLTGRPVVRDFDQSTRSALRKAGDIDLYLGGVYTSLIDHTPGIAANAEPGVNDDFVRIDNQAASGRTLLRVQLRSDSDLYTAHPSNPYFTFAYPTGTERIDWHGYNKTGYLDIDDRVSAFPASLDGVRGFPLTGYDEVTLRSFRTADFLAEVRFLPDSIRLELEGYGTVPEGDRGRFTVRLQALA